MTTSDQSISPETDTSPTDAASDPDQSRPADDETPTPEVKPETRTRSEKELRALRGDVEAILLSLDKPVPPPRLVEALELEGPAVVEEAIEKLNAEYDRTGRAFRIERVAGGFRLMTLPRHASAVASFQKARASTKLSRPAIETLAIIAYKQPITRATLESIRGVACGEVLRSLLERRLVTIAGRAEEVGRPMLYATSKQFLDAFGLSSIKDLPPESDLPRILEDA